MSKASLEIPKRLKAGDKVCLVSPASAPDRIKVAACVEYLQQLGLIVEVGEHVFDEFGLFAGTDEARLADFNNALRDPDVRAIFATRGGRGAYRIADKLDTEAARQAPKILVGFSEITILHLALYKNCRIPGIHGAVWDDDFSVESAESFRKAIFTNDAVMVCQDHDEPTHTLTTRGKANGVLLGGNQDMLATSAGWMLPDMKGAILLLEAVGLQRGQIDRQLTMLRKTGALSGLAGIAIGQYTDCGRANSEDGSWGFVDILRDQLERLNVPILGGLRIGHGDRPIAVPVGTMATLDADAGTLLVEAAVA